MRVTGKPSTVKKAVYWTSHIKCVVVREDHAAVSNAFRIVFEILLAIAAVLFAAILSVPATNNIRWVFLGVASLMLVFLGLSLFFSHRARLSDQKTPAMGWLMSKDHLLGNPLNVTAGEVGFAVTSTPEEWESAFLDWVNTKRPARQWLSDEAISRESIYREREDAQL